MCIVIANVEGTNSRPLVLQALWIFGVSIWFMSALIATNSAAADIIPVEDIAASSNAGGFYHPENLIDGSGLISSFPYSLHDDNYENMWLSAQGSVSQSALATLTFDLGGRQAISEIRIWNYNFDSFEHLLDRGVKSLSVYSSIDGISYGFVGEYSITRGTGSLIPPDVLNIDTTSAYFIRLDLTEGYDAGNQEYIGLSEVQFFGVIEEIDDSVLADLFIEDSPVFEYFPIKPGNQWSYLENLTRVVNHTVLSGSVLINGIDTVPVSSSDDILTYYTNDENGIRIHRQLEKGVDFGDGILRDFTLTYMPPMQFVEAHVSVGDESSGTGQLAATVAGIGTYILDYSTISEIMEPQILSLPPGSFPAIRNRFTIMLSGEIQGQAVNDKIIETYWITKHVGPIKVIEELVGDSVDTFKLIAVSIDTDDDGINVTADNCPAISNPLQTDTDGDGDGDACDTDDDNDGMLDGEEVALGRNPKVNEPAALGIVNFLLSEP